MPSLSSPSSHRSAPLPRPTPAAIFPSPCLPARHPSLLHSEQSPSQGRASTLHHRHLRVTPPNPSSSLFSIVGHQPYGSSRLLLVGRFRSRKRHMILN
ncbi:hypothetical protein L1987_09407 [Smallanthus sonchifolius]|uniref:Uncharacterized protein n=1 Tax=Smallanthus sonchifolius TaxID=185202 RepID=A0ACB9JNB7_9ASTR|nr:hypothetical protein L1987_09407 [Smallanthus sonchifolius]